MQRSKNHGFSVVEIILVVVVIAVLGFVGWRVYDARQDKDAKDSKNTSTTTPSATPSNNSPEDESKKDSNSTADWLHYEAPEYSINFADGWTVYKKESSQNSFYSIKDGDLKYVPGQKAVVKEYSASDASEPTFGFFMDYSAPASTPHNCTADSTLKLTSYKTDDGSLVYASAVSSPNQKVYSYCVQFSNNAELQVGYSIPLNAEDHSATVERVIRTVKIK